jgi:DNA-binding MarR family transcriptional regulator
VDQTSSDPFPHEGLTRRETLDIELLFLLEAEPGMAQREMAERLGISLGGVNLRLQALVRRGILESRRVGPDRAPGRRVYEITPDGRAEHAAHAPLLLEQKLFEFESLKQQIERLRSRVDRGE